MLLPPESDTTEVLGEIDPDRMSSDELIAKAQQGDLRAFGDLVRLHESVIRGYLRSRISDWSSADDVAQDVFITAFKKIKGFRGESSFEGWLRGIALNHLRNYIRKKKEVSIGDSEVLESLMNQAADSWRGPGEYQRLDDLRECLDKLDETEKELLMQRYNHGLTVREIEKETGKGYSALTMKLFRLREALADCMERKFEVRGA